MNLCLFEIVVPNFYEKTHILLQTFLSCFSLPLFFSLSIVNELRSNSGFDTLVSNGTAKVVIIFLPPNFF